MADQNPLQSICDQIATAVGTAQGIRRASGTPPPQISVFPFVDVYVQAASWTPVPMKSMTGMLTVNVDLHLAMKDQVREVSMMHRLHYGIVNSLWKAMQNNKVPALQTINKAEAQMTVFSNGAGTRVDTVGYQFKLEVKYQGVIT